MCSAMWQSCQSRLTRCKVILDLFAGQVQTKALPSTSMLVCLAKPLLVTLAARVPEWGTEGKHCKWTRKWVASDKYVSLLGELDQMTRFLHNIETAVENISRITLHCQEHFSSNNKSNHDMAFSVWDHQCKETCAQRETAWRNTVACVNKVLLAGYFMLFHAQLTSSFTTAVHCKLDKWWPYSKGIT